MIRRRAGGSLGGEHGRQKWQNRWALWTAVILAAGMLPVAAASAASVPAGAQAVQPPNTWSPTAGPMSVSESGPDCDPSAQWRGPGRRRGYEHR